MSTKIQKMSASAKARARAKCKICKIQVQDSDQGISCDVCLMWWHATKCLKYSTEKYELLSGDNVGWYCDGCKGPAKVLKNQMVTIQEKLDALEDRMKTLETSKITREDAIEVVQEELKSVETTEHIKKVAQEEIAASVPMAASNRTEEQNEFDLMKRIRGYASDMHECEKRESNLVFHKVDEMENGTNEEKAQADKGTILEICQTINKDLTMEDITDTIRLGKISEDKHRPLLVKYKEKRDAKFILENAKKLKGTKWVATIGQDLPKNVRKFRNQLITAAKENCEEQPEDFLFRIIGEPGREKVITIPKKKKGEVNPQGRPT